MLIMLKKRMNFTPKMQDVLQNLQILTQISLQIVMNLQRVSQGFCEKIHMKTDVISRGFHADFRLNLQAVLQGNSQRFPHKNHFKTTPKHSYNGL